MRVCEVQVCRCGRRKQACALQISAAFKLDHYRGLPSLDSPAWFDIVSPAKAPHTRVGGRPIENDGAPKILDLDALERLRRVGGDSLILRMIELFFSHTASKVDAAVSSFDAGQLDEVERAVHSIKSSAANLGAVELTELAAKLENLAGQRDAAVVEPLVRKLPEAFGRARERLEEQRRELGG